MTAKLYMFTFYDYYDSLHTQILLSVHLNSPLYYGKCAYFDVVTGVCY